MKSYLDLVPQYEKVHRKQSKMSRICIILAVFLVAVMFGLADMYLQGITQKVMQENGDWHYQITSIDTKTSDLIAARPEVEVSGWHSTISADAGYSISGQPIAISGLDEDVFGEIYLASLAEGKYPNTENTDVRVGDVITLSINGKEQAVTVAGILSDSPLAREEGTETIFCSEKTFVALTGQTGYTIIDVQFQNGASIEDVKDIENIFTDGGVVFTEQLSQVQQQRNLYSAFAVLVYGFLSIIVAITIFHIMNTINMGVIAKTKQYGAMRAIGMSNQQLIKMIVAEAMTYAVSGMILGCIIGLPMHWVVFASLITNFWGTAWSIPIFPLALIIGIVLFTSFLAVRSPAKRLHDMAIVDTIKSQQ